MLSDSDIKELVTKIKTLTEEREALLLELYPGVNCSLKRMFYLTGIRKEELGYYIFSGKSGSFVRSSQKTYK